MKNMINKIAEKTNEMIDKLIGLDGHYEEVIHEFIDENGNVFKTSKGFVWINH